MDIIVTNYIGEYGTGILAQERRNELLKTLPEWLVNRAAKLADNGCPATEAPGVEGATEGMQGMQDAGVSKALECGAMYAKQYTEFGVLEALYVMSKTLKTGLEADIRLLPIRQETVEICEALDVNPYALYSGNSAVVVVENGMTLVSVLKEIGVPAIIVGHTVDGNDKIVTNGDESGFLPHIRKDELKNILGRKEYYERTNIIDSREEQ